jgi:hypothetical protein
MDLDCSDYPQNRCSNLISVTNLLILANAAEMLLVTRLGMVLIWTFPVVTITLPTLPPGLYKELVLIVTAVTTVLTRTL